MKLRVAGLRGLSLLLALAGTAAQAQSYTYSVYLNRDGNTATGCTVTVGPESFAGAETRLDVSVQGGSTPSVTGTTRSECAGAAFGAGAPSSGAAIGLNTGTAGSDVIEFGAPITAPGDVPANATLGVSASAVGSTDTLFPVGFSLLIGGANPMQIPGLGLFGALLLAVVIVVGARHGLKKRRTWVVAALAACGLAVAASITVDGQVADWGTVTPVNDPAGDSGGNNAATDLRAAYATVDGGLVYFRIDVRDLQNQSPTATAPLTTVTLEDVPVDITLAGTDAEASALTFSTLVAPTRGTLSAYTQLTPTSARVTYTPNPNLNGADSFTFRTNDGSSFSQPANVAITVTPVNDQHSVANQSFTAVENSPNGTAVGTVAATDVDTGQSYAWAITAGNTGGAFTINASTGQITVANSTALDPTTTPTFSLTVTATDAGAPVPVASGTVTVTVTGINDAPSFTAGATQTVLEDAGAQSVAWATAISDNDGNTQALNFQVVSNSNPALFSAAPAISPTGTLTYTTAANANGSATLSVVLRDNGGVVGGGVDQSAAASLVINVTAVNDPPTFVAGANQSVLQSAATPQAVANWATGISAGPPDEAGQTLSFQITNDNPQLFDVQPTIAPNGELDFDPANIIGSANITVRLVDNGGTANGGVDGSPTLSFSISVDDVNDAPSFTSGGDVTVLEDAAPYAAAWATAIDRGAPNEVGQTVQFEIITNTNPALFSIQPAITPTGTLGFTLAASANGTSSVTVRLRDSGGTAFGGIDVSAPTTFAINATPVNDSPTVTGALVSFPESATATPRVVNAWAQFSPGPADESAQVVGSYTVTNVVDANGVLSAGPNVANDGTLTFTTAAFKSGQVTFDLTVTDNGTPVGTSAPTPFVIQITGVNDAPSVNAQTVSIAENSPNATLVATATGTDPDNDPLTWAIVGGNTNSAFAINSTSGAITVANSAALDFEALASFSLSVQATDAGPLSATGTITVNLTPVDEAPVAVNDAFGLGEDAPATTFDVLANDTDVDTVPGPGPKSVASVTQPANGVASVAPAGAGVIYTPNANYCSSPTPDTFTYTLTPGGSTATVSITVACVAEDPTAVNDAFVVAEDSGQSAVFDVRSNDLNPDGVALTVSAVTQPANGTVTFSPVGVRYTPNAAYCNSAAPADTFTYTLSPGGTTAVVSMTVTCVDDPPVAVADVQTVGEDSGATTIPVTANDTDTDGGAKAVQSVTQPTNGVVAIVGADLSYTPNANYCNTPPGTALDTFTYTLTPGGSTTSVTVTVNCVDDPAVGVADSATVAEDSSATAVDVLANDTDVDGGPKSVTNVTQPANGAVVITGGGTGLTYQPNANYCNSPSGSADTFIYTLTGGSTAGVSITVTCVDDNPVAVADTATVLEDSGANAVPVLANDTDVDAGAISITSVTQPANGAVVITGGGTGLTYAPNANYCNVPPGGAPDAFTYTLTPGGATTTVSVSVTCVDDPPVAVNDAATILEDAGAVAVNVLPNDTDIDGGPKTIASVTNGGNGTVAITGGGTGLTYAPALNYCNSLSGTPDTFTYTLNGGSVGTVSMTVTCVNDAPVASTDAWQTIGNTELRVDLAAGTTPNVATTTAQAKGVTQNDSDPVENDPFAVTGIVTCADVTAPFDCTVAAGRVIMQSDGKFSFTPAPGAAGPVVSFQYTVTDTPAAGTAASANGTVNITLLQRVWYVNGSAAAGGNGTSSSPLNTFAGINGANGNGDSDVANDIIFVHSSSVASSIELENGQKLWGEGFGLSVPVALNGGGSPTVLVAAGTNPAVTSNTDTVKAGNNNTALTAIEIKGLNLASTGGNAIDLTTTVNGTFGVEIANIQVTGATQEGIDVNQGSGGASTLSLHDVTNIVATGNGIDLARTSGSLTVTDFRNITVSGNTVGSGIVANAVLFDATPGGAVQTVDLGTINVGVTGNGVGGSAMSLTALTGGDLHATGTINLFADNGAGLRMSGTAATQFRVATGSPATGVISAINGPALDLTGAPTLGADIRLTAMTSTNSTTNGIQLSNVTGTVSAPTGATITNATGTDVSITGGTANVTYGGTITDDVGQLIRAVNTTAGTISFLGAVTDGDDGDGGIGGEGSVHLAGNTAAMRMQFAGGLLLSTSGNAAIAATGAGALEICDENPCAAGVGALVNRVTTTTATAVNLNGVTTGTNGISFRAVSAGTAAAGPVKGITLTNAGTGGFSINGVGTTAGSGGTIQDAAAGSTMQRGIEIVNTDNVTVKNMALTNATRVDGGGCVALSLGTNQTCNAPFYVADSDNIALDRIVINGSVQQGLNGRNVANFTMSNSSITGAGNAADEDGIHFFNMLGTSSLSAVNIASSFDDNVIIQTDSGTSNITVTGGSFNNSTQGSGFLIGARGTSNFTLTLNGVTLDNNFSGGAPLDSYDSANSNVTVNNSTITNNNDGIQVSASGNANARYTLTNNTLNNDFVSIGILKAAFSGGGTLQGTISSNNITVANGRTADAMVINQAGAGNLNTFVDNNNIFYGGTQRAILVQGGQDGVGALNVTLTRNDVEVQLDGTGNAVAGMLLQNAVTTPTTGSMCADVGGTGGNQNVFTHTLGGVMGAAGDIRVRQRNSGTVRLPGYGGAATDTTGVINYLAARNTIVSPSTATFDSSGFAGGAACTLPN